MSRPSLTQNIPRDWTYASTTHALASVKCNAPTSAKLPCVLATCNVPIITNANAPQQLLLFSPRFLLVLGATSWCTTRSLTSLYFHLHVLHFQNGLSVSRCFVLLGRFAPQLHGGNKQGWQINCTCFGISGRGPQWAQGRRSHALQRQVL